LLCFTPVSAGNFQVSLSIPASCFGGGFVAAVPVDMGFYGRWFWFVGL
jgi:hypothetical protein